MRRTRFLTLIRLTVLATECLFVPMRAFAEPAPLPASKAVAELGRELGVVIRLKGGEGRTVSPAAGGTPEARIAALAADLTGSWRRVLRVTEKAPPSPSVSSELERSVTLGFSDLPANKALAIVARQMGAEWDPDSALLRRVTLSGVSRTFRELLDEIGRQSGVSWTLEYRIEAPDAEAIRALSRPEPRPSTPVPPPVPAPDIAVSVIPTVPSPTVWSNALKESVQKLLKAAPDRRPAALDTFLKELGEAAVLLHAVSIERRPAYRNAGSRLYEQWTRLYRGLAPSVREELDPADGVIRDLLGR
jgi:hypothetical protein